MDTAILWFRSPIGIVGIIWDLFLFIKACAVTFLFNKETRNVTGVSLKACELHNYEVGIRPQREWNDWRDPQQKGSEESLGELP